MGTKRNYTMNSDKVYQTISQQFLQNCHSRLSE